jgi:hypothetical protein
MNRDEPAFAGNEDWMHCGLTKREYAAVHIMAGLMANPGRYKYIASLFNSECVPPMTQEAATKKNAHKAVLLADALFDELDKEGAK